jgi:hypothetical protein
MHRILWSGFARAYGVPYIVYHTREDLVTEAGECDRLVFQP